MVPEEAAGEDSHWFQGEVPCRQTGQRGYTVRVLPYHPELANPFLPGLIRWSSDPVGDGQPTTTPA
jgi:starch phosphorylase